MNLQHLELSSLVQLILKIGGMASVNISASTKSIYQQFNEIRGKSKAEIPFRFWDVVVLTASDEDQKFAFECQIEGKLERKEIPNGLPYVVFSDPPGPKIGCGGATMHVIHQLSQMYGEKLDKLLVLIINAGGQSQRLPSASVLGKIFTVLPYGEPPWQLLELKLACYLPFLPRMKPGYFHAASDTIEVFDIGELSSGDGEWNFFQPGLTALAHPSPLQIGATHGVFVLESGQNPHAKLAEFRNCVEVLQKPSVMTMREKEAVICNVEGIQELGIREEFVYTDSCFFFDHDMAKKLENFYLEVLPLECELDGYGDFMRSLGTRATDEFAIDLRNVSKVEPSLVETRKKLFRTLRGTPLNVITLNASKFYHLGTIRECLENFDVMGELAQCIGFVRNAFSISRNTKDSKFVDNHGCVIHSLLTAPCKIGRHSIVEYCDFQSPIDVGDNCLISNCTFKMHETDTGFNIPSGLFLHTIELKNDEDTTRCVTIALHVDDDVKKKASGAYKDVLEKVTFLGRPLSNVAPPDSRDLFANDNSDGSPIFCLWYARLFPILETKESSFLATMDLVKRVMNSSEADENWMSQHRVSAHEAVQMKDVQKMVYHRKQLFCDIKNAKQNNSTTGILKPE